MADFKKSEVVFKFGDAADKVVYLQSGRVRILVPKKNNLQEIAQISAPALLAEYCLTGATKHQYTVETLTPVKTLDVPSAKALQVVESAPDFLKVTAKSLLEGLKQIFQQLKTEQMKHDSAPLPYAHVPTVFYTLYALMKNHCEKNEAGHTVLKWKFAKSFAYKVFQIKPEQLEGALLILKKLGKIDLVYKLEKEDENNDKEIATEVLHDVVVTDVEFIFNFADFYQIYYYKSGSEGLLQVEEKPLQVLEILLACVNEAEADRRGVVRTTMKALIEHTQKNNLPPVKSDHFEVLAQKGIYCKMLPQESGEVYVSFDHKEFKNMHTFWKILKEIDLWNVRGKVLLVETVAKSSSDHMCTNGHSVSDLKAKFCPECGAKLAAAA